MAYFEWTFIRPGLNLFRVSDKAEVMLQTVVRLCARMM